VPVIPSRRTSAINANELMIFLCTVTGVLVQQTWHFLYSSAMSMPANPACFVAFLALLRRRRTTGVSDPEDRSPRITGDQEGRRILFQGYQEGKGRREEKRLLTF
jgi:hypothetical protein